MQSNRSSTPRVLIVEDEPAIAESLDYALRREGFETQTAATYAKAEAGRPTAIGPPPPCGSAMRYSVPAMMNIIE